MRRYNVVHHQYPTDYNQSMNTVLAGAHTRSLSAQLELSLCPT